LPLPFLACDEFKSLIARPTQTPAQAAPKPEVVLPVLFRGFFAFNFSLGTSFLWFFPVISTPKKNDLSPKVVVF